MDKEEALLESLKIWKEMARMAAQEKPSWAAIYCNSCPACEFVLEHYPEVELGSNQKHCDCDVVCPMRSIWDPPFPSRQRPQRYYSKGCWGNKWRSPYYRYAHAKTDNERKNAAEEIISGILRILDKNPED